MSNSISEIPFKRLKSLDAFRGIVMFIIIGGSTLIVNFAQATELSEISWIVSQLHHAKWGEGVTFYDFIFPMFLFSVGVSLYYSVENSRAKGFTKKDLYGKAFRRMLILIALGIVYKNRPLHFDWENIRYVSVLGRIGITGFLALVIVTNFDFRSQMIWMMSLLIGYWLAVMFVPVPGFGAGDLTQEGCLPGYIDRLFLPGRLINGVYDENGLLTQIPATSLVLIGSIAGQILDSDRNTAVSKIWNMSLFGGVLLLLSVVWSLHFPYNKFLWSSSFILLAGGVSMIAYTLLYSIVDVMDFHKWCFPFVVIGMNSILVYMLYRVVDFSYTADYLLNGFYQVVSNEFVNAFLQAAGVLVLEWLVLYLLFKNKIFVKV